MRNLRIFLVLIPVGLLLSSCNSSDKAVALSDGSGSYHSDKFRIERFDGFSVLTIINPWQGATGIDHKYYLVKQGTVLPESIPAESVIRVPVSSVVCLSTTHLAMFAALERHSVVTGFSGTSFLYDEKFIEMVQRGILREVGYEGNLNKELIMAIEPDLLIAYGVEGETASYVSKLKEMGVRIVFNAEHLEKDPVARLEWIKVFGALTCLEEEAEKIYENKKAAYDSLAVYIKSKKRGSPRVLLGLPWRDSWYISPNDSYIGALIEDAGGDYLWKELESNITMPFSMETVFLKARKADYWLNTGSASSKSDVSAIDSRLSMLPVYKSGDMYNNNRRIKRGGGNDYWEGAVINPDVLLKDIGSILHPELFIGYAPFYYSKLK